MTIPASEIVASNPAVIGSGGNPLSLNAVILSKNSLIPSGSVISFSGSSAVKDFFGEASDEYASSKIYFLGYDNSAIKPGTLYFAPFVDASRSAWLQSGSLSGTTLLQLQGMSGVLTVVVDGASFTSSSINLSTATSFSNAATMIEAGFSGTGKPTCEWNPVNSTFTLSSITIGASSSIGYAIGTLSELIKLTSSTGAITSQGAVEDTPSTAMDSVISKTQNWVNYCTMWEPDLDGKKEFSEWTNFQNQRYLYVCWDTDGQAIVRGSATCFGAIAKYVGYDAVMPVYNNLDLAALVLGTTASIDFSRTNGRISYAFKSQSGFLPTVTDKQIAKNLLENGYSFYGSYGTANDEFNFIYDGQVSGKWQYAGKFINQVYLNSQMQLALMSLLTNVNSISYNEQGYSMVRAAMNDPILSAINSGIIRFGISLSSSQKSQVNQAAGKDVASSIEQHGYYLQILDPGAQVRGNGGSPIINLWYTDGGDIQKITIASIAIM